MAIFGKPKFTIIKVRKREIPDGLWTKCEGCGQPIYNKTLEENFNVCPKCDHHFTLGTKDRIKLLIDEGTFQEYDVDMKSKDPLEFKGQKSYKDKLKAEQESTHLLEAVVTGEGDINGERIVLGVTDSRFMMGSMGSVVGEKITRAVEVSINKRVPLIIVSGSGGGARMYEGMLSLMQMAKTAASLARHHQEGLLYISVLTNPTMAGVMASFAGLGDVIIAEPKALIGFTGPRVIEQTIRQRLPEGFQRSEFLLEHGLIDMIVHRKNLKATLSQLIDYFG